MVAYRSLLIRSPQCSFRPSALGSDSVPYPHYMDDELLASELAGYREYHRITTARLVVLVLSLAAGVVAVVLIVVLFQERFDIRPGFWLAYSGTGALMAAAVVELILRVYRRSKYRIGTVYGSSQLNSLTNSIESSDDAVEVLRILQTGGSMPVDEAMDEILARHVVMSELGHMRD